ncbi:MAG: ATP-binding cassette domain-containing protein, partial [Candidatus Neomarinimicrobiota bacterium]
MMDHRKTLIYEIKNLKKSYGNNAALSIGNLQFHRGTIYGIIGPIGSGKSSLLKIMAGLVKPDSGTILYDSQEFATSWRGKIKPKPEILLASVDGLPKGQKVKRINMNGSKDNNKEIISRNFNSAPWKYLLDRSVNSLSPGELAWLNMVVAVESDPRVLLL